MQRNRRSIRSNRSPTNVAHPESLHRDARELRINISPGMRTRPFSHDSQARIQRWVQENRAVMDAWNDRVENYGLPLDRFRPF